MKSSSPKSLPIRKQRFIHEYVANFGNGALAAIAAGYSENYASAKTQAARLLKDPTVIDAVEALKSELSAKYKINEERIIDELSYIILFNFKDILSSGGNSLCISETLSRQSASAIESITFKSGRDGESISVQTYSKLAAIDQAAKYLGLFNANKDQKEKQQSRLVVQEALTRLRQRFNSDHSK